jgi:hypothetical protein
MFCAAIILKEVPVAILGVDCAIDQRIVCRRKPVDSTVQGRKECFRRTAGHNPYFRRQLKDLALSAARP